MKTTRALFIKSLFMCGLISKSYADNSFLEARAYIQSQCPVETATIGKNEFLAEAGVAILANIAGQVVGGLIDHVGKALTEDKQTALSATHRIDAFYASTKDSGTKRNPTLGCLVIAISDNFNAPSADKDNLFSNENSINKKDIDSINALKKMAGKTDNLEKIGIKIPPKFYLEAIFDDSSDNTAFTLKPVFIYYPKFFGDSSAWSKKSRDILIRAEFSKPGDESQPFASTQLTFNAIAEGSLTSKRLSGTDLSWMPMPESRAANNALDTHTPVNLKILVSETAKPNTIAVYLGNALKAQRDTLTTSVEDQVRLATSQDARQSHRQDLLAAASEAGDKYVIAFDAYTTAKAQVDAAQSAAEKAKAENAKKLAESKLKIAEALAEAAYDSADIPFEKLPR